MWKVEVQHFLLKSKISFSYNTFLVWITFWYNLGYLLDICEYLVFKNIVKRAFNENKGFFTV